MTKQRSDLLRLVWQQLSVLNQILLSFSLISYILYVFLTKTYRFLFAKLFLFELSVLAQGSFWALLKTLYWLHPTLANDQRC